MDRSSRSSPTGHGSRGGRWHDPEYRRAYHRAWRAAHPDYRERERLRVARARIMKAGGIPADLVAPSAFPRPLQVAAARCSCGCECRMEVVTVCGFCRDGIHGEAS